MVLVFCLLWLFGSGINFSFTYGSDRPFGSMGIRLRASCTAEPIRTHTAEIQRKHRPPPLPSHPPPPESFRALVDDQVSPVTKTSSFSPRTVRWIRPRFSVWSWPQRLGTLVSHRRWTFMSQPGKIDDTRVHAGLIRWLSQRKVSSSARIVLFPVTSCIGLHFRNWHRFVFMPPRVQLSIFGTLEDCATSCWAF